MAADCPQVKAVVGSPQYAAELSQALACQSQRNQVRETVAQRQTAYDAEVARRRRETEARLADARAQVARQAQEAADRAAEQERQQEQQAAAARQLAAEQERQEQQQAAAARQLAAENSPDNKCAQPENARMMLREMGNFTIFKRLEIEFIDIKHLTTVSVGGTSIFMMCHGTFLNNAGGQITGTFSIRSNIAGDPISSWRPDQ
jgi:hypothetical protein